MKSRMKKLVLLSAGLMLCTIGRSFAFGPSDIWSEIVSNSKAKLLNGAQLGYAWNLSKEDSGPIGLAELYQYRFLVLGAGWTSPFPNDKKGAVIATVGVHLDKLTRLIAPNASDVVKSIMPAMIQPVWDKLTFSYGPGYDFDTKELTHLVAVNFEFGDK